MANEFRKVTDQNGVDHPVCDDTRVDWSSYAVLGAKNLLPIKIEVIKSGNTTGTWDGNTYTLNGISYAFTVDNGYVTDISISGIASAASQVTLKYRSDGNDILTTGTSYTINGATGDGVILDAVYTKDGAYAKYGSDSGNGFTFTAENGTIGVALSITNGTDLTTPVSVKPMIRLSTDTDSTYVPYAMTNRELTDAVALKDVTSNITRNTEQTAYSISSLFVYKIGRLVTVIGDISSLTENAVPSGHAFTTIATGLPKALKGSNMFTMPIGSGNQTQVYVEGNSGDLKMRGGTTGQSYQFVFTYISAS